MVAHQSCHLARFEVACDIFEKEQGLFCVVRVDHSVVKGLLTNHSNQDTSFSQCTGWGRSVHAMQLLLLRGAVCGYYLDRDGHALIVLPKCVASLDWWALTVRTCTRLCIQPFCGLSCLTCWHGC